MKTHIYIFSYTNTEIVLKIQGAAVITCGDVRYRISPEQVRDKGEDNFLFT